jgi:hypothetical protein
MTDMNSLPKYGNIQLFFSNMVTFLFCKKTLYNLHSIFFVTTMPIKIKIKEKKIGIKEW